MSGRMTTPTCGGGAGAAYAAENSLPSAAVRVRVPRSATSPERGGAGGRLSWSWHMPGFYRRPARSTRSGLLDVREHARVATERGGRDLAADLGEPAELAVGLLDQRVQQHLVDPLVDLGGDAQRLEATALAPHGRGEELELDQVAQRRPAEQVPVQLEPARLLGEPHGDLLVLPHRQAQRPRGGGQVGLLLPQLVEQLPQALLVGAALVHADHPADQLDAAGRG